MNSTKFQYVRFEQEKQRLDTLLKHESLVSDMDQDLDKLVKIAAYICQTPIPLVNLIIPNHTICKAVVDAFDLIEETRLITYPGKTSLPVYLVISLHCGKVLPGLVSLLSRVIYTMSGKIVEESKHMREWLCGKNSPVFVSVFFHSQASHAVAVLLQHKLNGPLPLDVYEVALLQ